MSQIRSFGLYSSNSFHEIAYSVHVVKTVDMTAILPFISARSSLLGNRLKIREEVFQLFLNLQNLLLGTGEHEVVRERQ